MYSNENDALPQLGPAPNLSPHPQDIAGRQLNNPGVKVA